MLEREVEQPPMWMQKWTWTAEVQGQERTQKLVTLREAVLVSRPQEGWQQRHLLEAEGQVSRQQRG